MIGEKFGLLTVSEFAGVDRHGQKKFKCFCSCGGETVCLAGNLKKGNSKSCGCTRKKTCSERMSLLNLRHGKTKTKLWKTWKGIVERTTKPNSSHYDRYGGVGIGIFSEWLVFENFAKYIGEPLNNQLSIDRIDNEKGYFPGNIRWASAKEQAANRSTNVFVFVNNQIMITSEAAKLLNVSKSTIARWILSGKIKQIEKQKH